MVPKQDKGNQEMKVSIYLTALSLFVTGCANSDYKNYLQAQHAANAAHEANRKPLFELEAAAGQQITGLKAIRVYVPEAPQQIQQAQPNEWVGVIKQAIGIAGSVYSNKVSVDGTTSLVNSIGNTATSIANKIQAPAANVTYSIGGNGVVGDGQYTTTNQSFGHDGVIGNGTLNSVAGTGAAGGDYNSTTQSGTGVIGSGQYSTSDSHNVDTHPTTTTTTDNHSTN